MTNVTGMYIFLRPFRHNAHALFPPGSTWIDEHGRLRTDVPDVLEDRLWVLKYAGEVDAPNVARLCAAIGVDPAAVAAFRPGSCTAAELIALFDLLYLGLLCPGDLYVSAASEDP